VDDQPPFDITPETVAGFARYAGYGYTRERIAELAPTLQELMAQLHALWDVPLGATEMALTLPTREIEP